MKRFKRKFKTDTYELGDILKEHKGIKIIKTEDAAIEVIHNSIITIIYNNHIEFYNNISFKHGCVQYKTHNKHLYYFIKHNMDEFVFNDIPLNHIKQSHNYFLLRIQANNYKYYINIKKIDNILYDNNKVTIYLKNDTFTIENVFMYNTFYNAIKIWFENYKKENK